VPLIGRGGARISAACRFLAARPARVRSVPCLPDCYRFKQAWSRMTESGLRACQHDDVFNFVTRETQTPVQLEWKILIKEYLRTFLDCRGKGRGHMCRITKRRPIFSYSRALKRFHYKFESNFG